METPLPQDFKEFLALLNSEKIEYLVVVGFAVGFHGYPRPTGDLDIWVDVQAQAIPKLVGVLERFGFAGAKPELFLTPGRVVRMGVPPVRIEILNQISGVEFSDCYSRREQREIDGLAVNFIARSDLLLNKTAAGRDKDKNDLKQLRKRTGQLPGEEKRP